MSLAAIHPGVELAAQAAFFAFIVFCFLWGSGGRWRR